MFLILGLYTKACGWTGAVVIASFIGGVVYLQATGQSTVMWDSVFQLKDIGILGMCLFLAFEGSAEYSLDKQLG